MALFKCIHKCLFRGVSVRKDSVLEITDSESDMAVVKSSFVPVDAAPEKVEKPGAGNELTREQYMQKLDELGVRYKVRGSRDELKSLYEQAVDNSSTGSTGNTGDQPNSNA